MILDKNKVEEAAIKYAQNISKKRFSSLGTLIKEAKAFANGVSYAESQLSELAIEFYDWMQQFQDLSTAKRILEVNAPEELFQEFLKYKNEKS